MELGLGGRRAVVTGGSEGLGLAIAMGLAREGCRVSIAGRDERLVRRAIDEIEAGTAVPAHGRACDVTDGQAVAGWVEAAASEFGGLDLVAVTTSGPAPGHFDELSESDWESGYRMVLLPAVRVARAARPHLASGSSVLFVTSTSVREPAPSLVLSTVFRGGVAGLAKTLAREWGPAGIRVNHLVPGPFNTMRVEAFEEDRALHEGTTVDAVRRRVAGTVPLGRLGAVAEIADAAVFLLSGAAAYITGATLQVDGGSLRSVM